MFLLQIIMEFNMLKSTQERLAISEPKIKMLLMFIFIFVRFNNGK